MDKLLPAAEYAHVDALRRAVTRARAKSFVAAQIHPFRYSGFQTIETVHESVEFPLFTSLNAAIESVVAMSQPHKWNRNPLINAVLRGDKDMVTQTIKEENANAVDDAGFSSMHYALLQNTTEICKILLANGADINAKDKNGLSLIHHCASAGKVDCLSVLLSHGIDVNTPDVDGRIPLFLAIQHKQLEMVKYLHLNLANVDAIDSKGQCFIDYFDFDAFDPIMWGVLQSFSEERFTVHNMDLTEEEKRMFGVLYLALPRMVESFEDTHIPLTPLTSSTISPYSLLPKATAKTSELTSILQKLEIIEGHIRNSQPTTFTDEYSGLRTQIRTLQSENNEKDEYLEEFDSKIIVLNHTIADKDSQIQRLIDANDKREKEHFIEMQHIKHSHAEKQVELVHEFTEKSRVKMEQYLPYLDELKVLLDIVGSIGQVEHMQEEFARISKVVLKLERDCASDKSMDETVSQAPLSELISSIKKSFEPFAALSTVLRSSPLVRAYDESDGIVSLYGAQIHAIATISEHWKSKTKAILVRLEEFERIQKLTPQHSFNENPDNSILGRLRTRKNSQNQIDRMSSFTSDVASSEPVKVEQAITRDRSVQSIVGTSIAPLRKPSFMENQSSDIVLLRKTVKHLEKALDRKTEENQTFRDLQSQIDTILENPISPALDTYEERNEHNQRYSMERNPSDLVGKTNSVQEQLEIIHRNIGVKHKNSFIIESVSEEMLDTVGLNQIIEGSMDVFEVDPRASRNNLQLDDD